MFFKLLNLNSFQGLLSTVNVTISDIETEQMEDCSCLCGPSSSEASSPDHPQVSVIDLLNVFFEIRNANLTDRDVKVLKEVAKNSQDELTRGGQLIEKIQIDNLPEISSRLEELGIELTDLITNPNIFFEFLDDPVKSLILLELNEILPTFTPPEVETFLLLQQAFDRAEKKIGEPEASDNPVLSKMLNLLMSTLPTLPTL